MKYLSTLERLIDAVLTSPAVLSQEVRRAAARRGAQAAGGTLGAGDVPANLDAYVDKVAKHAYRVTDEDIASLRSAGYSEDAIFEATVATALGAGIGRAEVGLRVIEAIDQEDAA